MWSGQIFFCKEPRSRYFRLCEPSGLWLNYSTMPWKAAIDDMNEHGHDPLFMDTSLFPQLPHLTHTFISLLYPATTSPLYPGIYKVSSRGIRVKTYALFELWFQCLSNLIQQASLGVACHYVRTFETFIHKENYGPWVMIGIWNKHWTLLKMRGQDFYPHKTRESPVTNTIQILNL